MRPRFPVRGTVTLARMVCLAWTPAAFSNQVSLSPQLAAPSVNIVFEAQAGSISGVQFDLEYDNSVMSLVPALGEAALRSGKNLYHFDLAPNKKRLLIAGVNQNLIPEGTLISLSVNPVSNAAGGEYPLKFSNIMGTSRSGQPVPMVSVDGTVRLDATISSVLRLQPLGILSAASLLAGPVAPGQVVRLVGSDIGPPSPQRSATFRGDTLLGGTSVLFDGIPASLTYAAPNEIILVVPYEVQGKTATEMRLINQGRLIAELRVAVAEAVPAVFTLDFSGTGPAFINNEDSSWNSPSNPAARGSSVTLFATGAGRKDSSAKPILPVSVQIGGLGADVVEPPGPQVVNNVLLVKCRIPANVAPGNAVPVVLRVGQATSRPGVTLAIR